jgi:multisubunit Na+/H+ antiporter MnhB subunit
MSNRTIAAVIVFSVITVFFVVAALLIHPFGMPDESDMDDYIINNTQKETGANNGVTSVVFDYRGFDTLGEATVLFTAVAGVILIFRRLKND